MKRIEIKIIVEENQKEDLKRFISDCKKHGFEVTREGGGRLPNWSGWYASLEGENWCPLPDVEEKKELGTISFALVSKMINDVSHESFLQAGGTEESYKEWWEKRNKVHLNISK